MNNPNKPNVNHEQSKNNELSVERKLLPGETITIDNTENSPLIERDELKKRLGIEADVVAIINAGGNELSVLYFGKPDRNILGGHALNKSEPEAANFSTDYLVVGDSFMLASPEERNAVMRSGTPHGYKGIHNNQSLIPVGRHHDDNRLGLDKNASRTHFNIGVYDQGTNRTGVIISNENPTNGTTVTFGPPK